MINVVLAEYFAGAGRLGASLPPANFAVAAVSPPPANPRQGGYGRSRETLGREDTAASTRRSRLTSHGSF